VSFGISPYLVFKTINSQYDLYLRQHFLGKLSQNFVKNDPIKNNVSREVNDDAPHSKTKVANYYSKKIGFSYCSYWSYL